MCTITTGTNDDTKKKLEEIAATLSELKFSPKLKDIKRGIAIQLMADYETLLKVGFKPDQAIKILSAGRMEVKLS